MADLKMNIPPEVIIGSINRLGDEAVYLGSRVLLVADSALGDGLEEIKAMLESRGLGVILFTDLIPAASSFTLRDALSMARGSHANVIIGMGGVKTLQLARATAALAREDIYLEDYIRGNRRPVKGLPYIEVPTSGRNPLMFRPECLLTEHTEKFSRLCPLPEESLKLIFLDPLFLNTCSPRMVRMILMDILLHSVEAYLTSRSSFFSDVQTRQALSLASSVLTVDNRETLNPGHFNAVYEASLFSAYATALNGPGAGTVLSYVLSGYTGKPKAAVSSVLLPALVGSSFYPAGEKKSLLAKHCYREGEPEDFMTMAPADLMERFQGLHDLPSRFSQLGITSRQLSEAASLTYAILEAHMPGLTQETLFDILQRAA